MIINGKSITNVPKLDNGDNLLYICDIFEVL
jgi:hypothetical protein